LRSSPAAGKSSASKLSPKLSPRSVNSSSTHGKVVSLLKLKLAQSMYAKD
jgi:hypothetical protein